MTRDEHEMALWRRTYDRYYAANEYTSGECGVFADVAAEAFRRRYPPQPVAPEAVWYDEPPRPGEYFVEGLPSVCWVEEDTVWCPSWDRSFDSAVIREMPRDGRRVCPIVKPPDPTP